MAGGMSLAALCFMVAAIITALSFLFVVAAAVVALVIILVMKNKKNKEVLADAVSEAVDSADKNA